jgi:hypothetical protein
MPRGSRALPADRIGFRPVRVRNLPSADQIFPAASFAIRAFTAANFRCIREKNSGNADESR